MCSAAEKKEARQANAVETKVEEIMLIAVWQNEGYDGTLLTDLTAVYACSSAKALGLADRFRTLWHEEGET